MNIMKSSRIHSILILLSLVSLAGCASLPQADPPLTLDRLVERSKSGESLDSLIAAVRGQREAFGLTGSDFARLRERGLPDRLLDELFRLEISAAEERERLRHWEPPWPRYRLVHPIIIAPAPKPRP